MAVSLSFIGGAGWQFLDNNANPLSGGKIYTYAAGTTTPLATYTARDGLTPNSNPIILDAAGRTPQQIWATEGLLYKYVVASSTDVVIRTWDNIGGSVVSSDLAADLANTTNNAKGDALVGFKQSNSSGFLTGATARTVNGKLQEVVSVKDFGAVGDGAADDTIAIQTALNGAYAANAALYFPPGRYLITSTVSSNINMLNVDMRGDSATIISTVNGSGLSLAPYTSAFVTYSLSVDAPIGTFTITAPGHNFVVNDIIYIRSSALGLVASFNYLKAGAYTVVAVSGDIVTVDRPLRFSFNTADAAFAFKNNRDAQVKLSGLTFVHAGDPAISGTVVSIRYANKVVIDNCQIKREPDPAESDGVTISESSNIYVTNFYAQDVRYPLNIQRGAYAYISNIRGDNVRHFVDFNSFFEYGYVDGFGGSSREGGINTHPAFNIHYLNGTTSDSGQVSNHRAVGGSIRNCTARFGENAGSNGMLFGMPLAEPEPLLDPAFYGLTFEIENFNVVDNRTVSGSGVASVYGGVFKNINYVKNGTPNVYDFSITTAVGRPSITQVSNLNTDNVSLVNLYNRNASTPWVTSVDYQQDGDVSIDAVLNGSVYECRFRTSPNIYFDSGVWRYKGTIVRRQDIAALDVLFEMSPVTNTFPDRVITLALDMRVENQTHRLVQSMYQSGTSIVFGTAALEDFRTNAATCLITMGVPTVDATTRDTTFPLTFTKPAANRRIWLSYDIQIQYL